jgi:hypothetical protein
MTGDYINNPWNGAQVAAISNELRHDIGANLTALIPKIISMADRLQTIYSDLSLEWVKSYSALHKLIPILDLAKQSPLIPLSWIIDGEITPFFDDIPKCEERKTQFLKKQNELETHYQIILENDNSITDFDLDAKILIDTDKIKYHIIIIQSYIAKFPYSRWNFISPSLFDHLLSLFDEAKEKAAKMNELLSGIMSQFENEIFDIDFTGIYNRYKTDYISSWKILKISYRRDRKSIRIHYKTIVKKLTDEMVLDTLVKLREIAELRNWFFDNQNKFKDNFGDLYNAEKTDFVLIQSRFTCFAARGTPCPNVSQGLSQNPCETRGASGLFPTSI